MAIFLQAETLSYKQDVFWFCGNVFSFKTEFFEGLQNSAGSLGENKPFGGTKEKMLAVCGVLLPHPVETLGTSPDNEHVGVPAPAELPHNPARLPGQCPAWNEGQAEKEFVFFFNFYDTKHQIAKKWCDHLD